MQPQSPIFWHQGLFLQPQHFQLTEAFQRFRHEPLLRYATQYFWGVGALRINEPGFGNKLFEVQQGEFIFPDGSCAVFPGNAVLHARSFDQAWVESEKPFNVFIGLYKEDPAGGNVTQVPDINEPETIVTRYVVAEKPEEIPDALADGPPAMVRRMRYVLRIFWENEIASLDNYHLLPLAQLERVGENIQLAQSFIPPSLSIRSSSRLFALLKEIRDMVGSRCRQLEDYKSPRDLQGGELELRYMVFLLALRSLNRYVPLLQHQGEAPNLHPWIAYGVLRQLVGELSTFSERVNAFGESRDGSIMLPPYDHENLWACFSTARDLINKLLESIMLGPEFLIRLEYDGEYYSAELPETFFAPGNNYWLVLRTTQDLEQVLDSLRHLVKLSAVRNLTTLIARAVPGIPLEFSPEAPSGLPRGANAYYFKIDKDSGQWRDVEENRQISLYWDAAPKDLFAELVVLRS